MLCNCQRGGTRACASQEDISETQGDCQGKRRRAVTGDEGRRTRDIREGRPLCRPQGNQPSPWQDGVPAAASTLRTARGAVPTRRHGCAAKREVQNVATASPPHPRCGRLVEPSLPEGTATPRSARRRMWRRRPRHRVTGKLPTRPRVRAPGGAHGPTGPGACRERPSSRRASQASRRLRSGGRSATSRRRPPRYSSRRRRPRR